MVVFYNIFIALFHFSIIIAAKFNPKAKQWLDGRTDIFTKIKAEISPETQNSKPKTRIWLHVASLGEFEQGRPLIEELKNIQATGDRQQFEIILTFFSPSGYEIRKNYPLADHIFYLPLDTATNAKQFLNIIKPDIAIFIKYEFWFHYLNELKQRQIPTLLVSGIFREKQFSLFQPYSYLLKKMLPCFTHFFVQNTPSVILLKKHGFQNVTLAGDTRIDRVAKIPHEGKTFPLIEQFVGDSPIFIGGSTWEADEKVILPLLHDENFKEWKFLFAPHDISIHNIERLEKSLNAPSMRYSSLEERGLPQPSTLNPQPSILIIDNVGMLSALYRYGRVAYIGGGFGKGIHNTLEPIAFGLPVIFGPKYEKFEEAHALIASGGAFCVSNALNLIDEMLFLSESDYYKKAAMAARQYVKDNIGATEKVIDYIHKI